LTAGDREALKEWRSEHRWSPNQLRHTVATKIRKNFNLEAARVSLGHSSASTTEIYAEQDMDLARSVARQIGCAD
jgi:site-specific recombinase XerC